MDEQLFLFGTGKISEYYTHIIQYLSIKIYGYLDNDKKKWGKLFYDIMIYNPNVLKETREALVIIACSDVKAITDQLSKMGMKDRIIKMGYIMMKRGVELEITGKGLRNFVIKNNEERTIVIDNLNGKWGGAEDWAHKLSEFLMGQGYNIIIIEDVDSKIGIELEQVVLRVNKKNKTSYEIYLELIEELLLRKPFTVFNIWNSEVLWASCYIKGIYSEEIQIISCVLNDNVLLYNRQCEWDECIDMYFCISSRIKNNLKYLYGINKKKIEYRVPFVENIRYMERRYCIDGTIPLKIGYPCRLSKNQKRADLLPVLIEKLEERFINYVLNVVGTGECEEEIKKYVDDNKLYTNVKFYGKLSRKELIEFLNRQDIYLNFSEYEGTSLTMLEAMASGCVPVVTNVSGVSDFIENERNGLISDVGDMDSIADDIFFLDRNREKLEEYGRKCISIVSNKCKINDYMNYIERLIKL